MISEVQIKEMRARFKLDLPAIIAGHDPLRIDHRLFTQSEPLDGLPSVGDILDTVCAETHYTRAQLIGKRRHKGIAQARQLFAVLADELAGASGTQIADAIRKDASAISYQLRKGRDLIQYDEKTRKTYLRIKGFFGE